MSLVHAVALSLALHFALLALGPMLMRLLPTIKKPLGSSLSVRLTQTAPARENILTPQPELFKPEDTAPKAVTTPVKPSPWREVRPETLQRPATTAPPVRESATARDTGGPQELRGEAALKAAEQIAQELFYPLESVARGEEGQALVLIFLDARGNVIAARIESSSGYRLLDDAAVRVARTLKALPASAPREALLPVRFKLR